MRRVGGDRLLLILLVLMVSVYFLAVLAIFKWVPITLVTITLTLATVNGLILLAGIVVDAVSPILLRVGRVRLLLILLVLNVSVLSLGFQNISLLGLKRGSDAVLGMRLGLDLQGGVHLVYQARGSKEIAITFQEPVDVAAVRSVLSDMGKTDAVVQPSGDLGVTVRVSSLRPEERDSQGNVLRVADEAAIRLALEDQVGTVVSFGPPTDVPPDVTGDQMEGVLDIITRRINPYGITEPVLQIMDDNRILLQLPGIRDVEEVKKLIGHTARLEFKERTCLATGPTILPSGEAGSLCDLPENHEDKETGLTGEDLIRAFAGTHPRTGLPIVNLQFNSRGTQIFAELTTRLAGTPDQFAIFLDEEEIISPVVIQPILSGNPFIEGRTFTPDRVRTLVIQLESGRLPIPIEVVQEQDVDATLGAESLRKSFIAGIAGLGLVLLFMVAYYRTAGVVAALALVFYAAAVLAILKLVPVTLTLSGIAAFILSIGMAVDANILIFERMKEELRLGRTLASAIEIGFNRAWPAIRDSNVSTLITSVILIWFGQRLATPMLAGFGTTLSIGVLVSMFSAIFVSKTLLVLFGASFLGRRRSWYTPESLPAPSRPGPGMPPIAEERE